MSWESDHSHLAANLMEYGPSSFVKHLKIFNSDKDLDDYITVGTYRADSGRLPTDWRFEIVTDDPPFYESIRAWDDKRMLVHEELKFHYISSLALFVSNRHLREFMSLFAKVWIKSHQTEKVGLWRLYEQIFVFGMILEKEEMRAYGVRLIHDQDLFDSVIEDHTIQPFDLQQAMDTEISTNQPLTFYYVNKFKDLTDAIKRDFCSN